MNRVIRIGMSPVIVLLLIGLTACAPQVESPGEAPGGGSGQPDQPTSAPPTTEPPTTEPAGEPTDLPVSQNIEDIPAAMSARQILAQVLWVDPTDIEFEDAEAVEWTDSCLGIAAPEVSCAQVVVPGYRVWLRYSGDEYLFRTDAQGGQVVLAEGPAAEVASPVLTYRGTAPIGCVEAVYGLDRAAVGMCGGAKFLVPYNNPLLAESIVDFNQTYTPVEASNQAGTITFDGQGDVSPGATEQRMLAEWGQMHAVELVTGFINPSYGVLLQWDRVGGIAGFCDSLTVYWDGWAVAGTCMGETVGQGRLPGDQLSQLYEWADTLEAFDLEDSGPPDVSDAMTIHIMLDGSGSTPISGDQFQQIGALASEIQFSFQQ